MKLTNIPFQAKFDLMKEEEVKEKREGVNFEVNKQLYYI